MTWLRLGVVRRFVDGPSGREYNDNGGHLRTDTESAVARPGEQIMAVAVVMDFNGATLEQYDQVISKMHLTPGGQGPPGALFHWCAATGSGILVTVSGRHASSTTPSRRARSGRRPPRSGFRGRPTSRSTTSTVISLRVGPDVTLRIPPWGPIPEHAPRGARPAAAQAALHGRFG